MYWLHQVVWFLQEAEVAWRSSLEGCFERAFYVLFVSKFCYSRNTGMQNNNKEMKASNRKAAKKFWRTPIFGYFPILRSRLKARLRNDIRERKTIQGENLVLIMERIAEVVTSWRDKFKNVLFMIFKKTFDTWVDTWSLAYLDFRKYLGWQRLYESDNDIDNCDKCFITESRLYLCCSRWI